MQELLKKSGDLVDCVMQFLLLKHEHVKTHRAISSCHIKRLIRLIVTCKQQLVLQTIIPYTGIIMSNIELHYILIKKSKIKVHLSASTAVYRINALM